MGWYAIKTTNQIEVAHSAGTVEYTNYISTER